MSTDNELTRFAYLDGELGVEEVISFETDLSTNAKADLDAERRFEAVLTERLTTGVTCPDAVWNEIKSRIGEQTESPVQRKFNVWPIFAAAAAVILAFVFLRNQASPPPQIAVSLPQNLVEFAADVTVPGDFTKVRSSMTEHGFHIRFEQPSAEVHHHIRLLGLRYTTIAGQEVAHLYFSCCEQPVSVFITKELTTGNHVVERHFSAPSERRLKRESNTIDQYRLHAFSHHGTAEVLDLFS